MKNNPLKQLGTLGQSIWLDYIRRDLMASGGLQRLIEEDGSRGMTSNPSIFEKAIAESHDYDEDIKAMALKGKGVQAIYENLSQRDVQSAADEFRPLYDGTDGADGYVSLEVNPHLAHDTTGTIEEARRLWAALGRPNVLIKVPATAEGLPAIQPTDQRRNQRERDATLRAASLSRSGGSLHCWHRIARGSRETGEAYCIGGQLLCKPHRCAGGPLLEKSIAQGGKQADLAKKAHGQVAIASAKMAYQIFEEIFGSARFQKLASQGARFQRLLWASTSTKNPAYSDVKYMEALIGPDTVNTAPMETLDAYRNHGDPKARLEQAVVESRSVIERLPELGIAIEDVTQQLENEGVRKFNEPFDKLMQTLAQRSPPHLAKAL
jgi:transaldolase